MDFIYSDTNKRYHTLDYDMRSRFAGKVVKLPVDCGFTCPNRDGSRGTGGCSYCSALGSGDFAESGEDVRAQLERAKTRVAGKWHTDKYIAYFQSFTNTYAPTQRLKDLFEAALEADGIVGIAIATRPDCLPQQTIEYLHDLNKRTFLTVELGLQTVHDSTAKQINRCHTFEDFVLGYRSLEGIARCVHIIDGLPGEDHEMMMETAQKVAELAPEYLKIHLLHVLRGTRIADEYAKGDFECLTLGEYVNTVCDQLELMPPETVIERLTGDGKKSDLIAPLWSTDKRNVLNSIDKELVKRDSFQGKYYKS